MAKPKSFKDLLLGILFMAILGGIAYGIAWLVQTDPAPGDIMVYSGEAEVTALQRVIDEQQKRKGSVAGEERFEIETDAENFPVVNMEKSIMLEATQDPISDMYYTVYEEDGDELYYRSVFFEYPEEPGTYYVVIDTMWGRRDHHFTTQHGFTLVME